MSNFDKYLIIYSVENQPVAENIATTLQAQGKEAMILEKRPLEFTEQLGSTDAPDGSAVILLITDNFLKSTGCMNGALHAAHKWSEDERLIPLVSEGIAEDQNGEPATVETKFERVGDIIQYMNYWQDKYLQLRKEKRKRETDEELGEQVAVTKDISAEVGEFLRYIRGIGYQQQEEFTANIGQANGTESSDRSVPEGAAILQSEKGKKKAKPNAKTEPSLVEMIEKSSEELMAENAEIDQKVSLEEMDEEITEQVLREMPGLDLLEPDEEEDRSPVPIEKNPEKVEDEPDGNAEGLETFSNFTEGEIEKLDGENDELMSILDEVFQEDGDSGPANDDEFHFVNDDPDGAELDYLLDDDENVATTTADEEATQLEIGEDEVLLNIVDDDFEDETLLDNDNFDVAEILNEAVKLFRDNRTDEGVSHFAESVEKHPQNTTLRYYYAYSLGRYAKEVEKAKTQLELLLKQDSRHPDAWFLLAELAENQQDFDGAKKCFQEVISCEPAYPNAHYRLGLLTAGHFKGAEKEAAEHFKAAIEHDPENADAEYMLATILNEHLGEPENSIKHFKRALALHPQHPFANYDLALVYYQFGDKKRAAEFYSRATAINPELKSEQNDAAFTDQNLLLESILETPEMASAPVPDATLQKPGFEDDPIEGPETLGELEKPETELKAQKNDVKTVLITGGTAGIGKATAEVFAKNGYRVIITGRREERLEEISSGFSKKYQTPVHTAAFDVRDQQSVNSALGNLPEEWQDIDILINNAGLSRGLAPIHEGQLEHWDTMIDTNVKGLLYIIRAIAPQMVKRKKGHIINVSSIAGTEVYPGGNVYCASKAAVSSLTRSMRLDLHKHNIRVSQVAPGHVEETEFARVRFDGDAEKAAKVYENFQPLTSSDVAETIFFIATRPPHVNIQDIYMFGTQQASATQIERSGR